MGFEKFCIAAERIANKRQCTYFEVAHKFGAMHENLSGGLKDASGCNAVARSRAQSFLQHSTHVLTSKSTTDWGNRALEILRTSTVLVGKGATVRKSTAIPP